MNKKYFFLGLTIVMIAIVFFYACQEKPTVIGISLNKESLNLEVGDTITLLATVYPEDANNKTVTWTSSNTTVATVSNNGLVTALKKGEATITVTTKDGNKKTFCAIKVNYYRDKWLGEYEGIHIVQEPYTFDETTYPCSILVEAPQSRDSAVYIYIDTPVDIGFGGDSCFVEEDGTFFMWWRWFY